MRPFVAILALLLASCGSNRKAPKTPDLRGRTVKVEEVEESQPHQAPPPAYGNKVVRVEDPRCTTSGYGSPEKQDEACLP